MGSNIAGKASAPPFLIEILLVAIPFQDSFCRFQAVCKKRNEI